MKTGIISSSTPKPGRTMIFDVSATRHGSRLDADVAILDERGEELAWVDDTTIFGDPHLEFTFAKTGDYVVRVGSLNGGGQLPAFRGSLALCATHVSCRARSRETDGDYIHGIAAGSSR